MMFKKAVKILESKVGLEVNDEKLLPQFPLRIEVKSLLSDFNDVKEIPYSSALDGYISIREEQTQEAFFEFSEEEAKFRGPFSKLAEEASDSRFTLWGNQGFLFRYILFLLEKKHQIYNMHGCALYQEAKNRIYLVIGGAGSGKTVYLLSGIQKGLNIFSTEIVHFRIKEGEIQWFVGSLIDNVRIGTLRHNFPRFLSETKNDDPRYEWERKVALDLSDHKTAEEIFINPEIVIIFPRIEEGRGGFLSNPVKDERMSAKFLFDNVSQKLSESVILYDKIPLVGLDNATMAMKRLKVINDLVRDQTVKKVVSVLSNPNECWGDLLR